MTISWEWIAGNLDEIAAATLDHLQLTLIAVGVGFTISLVLGLAAYRWRGLYGPIAGVAGLLYTIPSLALFAVLVPFTGLTVLTAEIGLVTYTLLILVRGVVSGLDGVPRDAVEAATGMGYTRRQRLARVELPLAVPVIVTAIRLATVTTIGLVMVTALIGEGGLGQLMLRGFNRSFPTMIYVGVVMSIVLAVALDLLLVGGQRLLTPWTRARVP
jgi:osmoprotectant transport system permease protein